MNEDFYPGDQYLNAHGNPVEIVAVDTVADGYIRVVVYRHKGMSHLHIRQAIDLADWTFVPH